MINRKIKNATPKEYDGIVFRSVFEADAYKKLKENGFSPLYEAEKVVLFKGFKPLRCWYKDGVPVLTPKFRIPKILDVVYTPDFKLEINGVTVYIEIKGFPNDVYPYKRKLFLKYLLDKNAIFFEVHNMSGLMSTIERLKDAATFRQDQDEQSISSEEGLEVR